MTPLKGADGQVYGMAQGNLLVGGFGAAASGSRVQVNHLSVGRITGGATVERAVVNAVAAQPKPRRKSSLSPGPFSALYVECVTSASMMRRRASG